MSVKPSFSHSNIQNQPTVQSLQKQLLSRDAQYKKQKALLQQKIQFLQQQLQQYRKRECENKKINESIMVTYQQNQNMREQHISRSTKIMAEKHKEQLARVKEIGYKQSKMLEDAVNQYKSKYQHQLIQNDRKNIQWERKLLQIKKKYQIQLKKEVQEKQMQYESKISMLNQKLKQAEGMADIYQDFVHKRRQAYNTEGEEYLRPRQSNINRPLRMQSSKQYLKQNSNFHQTGNYNQNFGETRRESSRKSRLHAIEQNNIRDFRRLSSSRQSIRQLTTRIDKAVVQLKGGNKQHRKLHQKINEKLAKRICS